MLALHGQGRYDQVPAGDLGLLKLVGRLRTGNPHARAERGRGPRVLRALRDWKGWRWWLCPGPPRRRAALPLAA